MSAYDTTPADIDKRGIRLSIRGGVATSLCFSVEKSGAINPFTTGRYDVVSALGPQSGSAHVCYTELGVEETRAGLLEVNHAHVLSINGP